jgi:predicted oxidoreductase
MSVSRVALYPNGLEVSSLIYGAWRLLNPLWSPLAGDRLARHQQLAEVLQICAAEHGCSIEALVQA